MNIYIYNYYFIYIEYEITIYMAKIYLLNKKKVVMVELRNKNWQTEQRDWTEKNRENSNY